MNPGGFSSHRPSQTVPREEEIQVGDVLAHYLGM